MKTLCGYEVVDAKARQSVEELQEAIDNIDIPEVDLSKHALKSEIPTKVSQLQNDAKYITRDEVPETDLSEYAKKSEIPDVSDFITNIPSEYITETELEAKGYSTKRYVDDMADDIAAYVDEKEVLIDVRLEERIPTKVSQLLNDKQYVTKSEVPDSVDTSNFITKTTVNDQYNWYVPTTNKNQVIQNDVPLEKMDSALEVVVGGKTLNNNSVAMREGLQLRVPETPTKTNHATSKAYVDKQIAAIPATDLSGYALKSSVPTKVSQLTNDKNYLTAIPSEYVTESDLNGKGYLTSVPSEYITESELNTKGYLTQHQSLSGYATENYVAVEIAKAKLDGNDVDLSGYATKDDIKDFITELPEDLVTEAELNAKGYITDVSHLATKASIPTKVSQLTNDKNYISSIPDDYVTEADLATKGYITDISSKADVEHEHTQYMKSEDFNNWEQVHSTDIENRYAQKSYVDEAIAGIDIPEVDDDAYVVIVPSTGTYVTDTATIEALDRLYDGEMFALYLEFANNKFAVTRAQIGTDTVYLTITSYISKGMLGEVYNFRRESKSVWKFTQRGTITQDVPTKTSQLENDSEFVTQSELTHATEVLSATDAALNTRVSTLEKAGYIKSIPSEYVTESELSAKGYITTSAASSNYFSKSYGQQCQADIAEIKATLDDVETTVADAATKSYVTTTIANAYDSSVDGKPQIIIGWDSVTNQSSLSFDTAKDLLNEMKAGRTKIDNINLLIQDGDHDLMQMNRSDADFANVRITSATYPNGRGNIIELHGFVKTNSGDLAIVTYTYTYDSSNSYKPWRVACKLSKLVTEEVVF